MSDIKAMNCPNCGGVVDADSGKCKYCGALLATRACPHCFGVAFIGSKFCPHCGEALADPVADGVSILACPRCKDFMQQRTLAGTTLTECDKCGGLWIDPAAFEHICADRQNQSAMLGGMSAPLPPATRETNPHYLACPRCQQLMNRVNFAHASGVVIDTCQGHGIWFDRDELRRIVEFILAGGINRANDARVGQLENQVHQLQGSRPDETLAKYSDQAIYDACRFAGGLLRSLMH